MGARPAWLDDKVIAGTLAGFSVRPTVSPRTRIVHLARHAPETVAAVRAAHPDAAVVVELGPVASTSADALLDAVAADVALVETEQDAERARTRVAELGRRVTVAPTPVDLEWHAPESTLTKLSGAYIKRFRRLHRLADPTMLFVGPYTLAGGLDVAIAAAYRLREELENVRLAAIPLGTVDQKYLDRCEMEALALGHRGIVEWTTSKDDLRCWYATATVVCCPWREAAEAAEAPVLAAAAARPFVGSDLPVFRDGFRAPDAPALIPPGDVDALVGSLESLLSDPPRASALGEAARSAVEGSLSYEEAARRLASVWSALIESPLNEAA
jgi:glycosyltransferase involved in cell wall biosynthesis